jgi:hypothetical protein
MYNPEKDPPNIRKETKPHESRKVDAKTAKFAGKVALRGK